MQLFSLALVALIALFLWSPASPLQSQVGSAGEIDDEAHSTLEADPIGPNNFDPCAINSVLPQCPPDIRAH